MKRTTAYVRKRIRDLPSPIESGKFKARAILSPPRNPPQVIINAVFFSKLFFNESNLIGIKTPVQRDKTTNKIMISKIIIYIGWNVSKTTIISNPIRMNKMAFNVSSSKCQNLYT